MEDTAVPLEQPTARTHGTAWTTRLTEAIDTIYLAFRINLVWMVLSVLGLVVLGVAPATVAAAETFIAARHGNTVRVLPMMWESFRENLVSANLRMLPLFVVQAGSVAMVWIIVLGAIASPVPTAILGTLAAISAGWSIASLGAIAAVSRVRDQDLFVTWRLALMIPAVLPFRAVPLVALILVWVLLCSMFWPLALLLGAGTAIGITVKMLRVRVELLLEDIKKMQDTPAPE